VQHRFVHELFAGAVPDAVMARYLIQDHRFLDEPTKIRIVDFLRTELDRVGPAHADCAATSFFALSRSNSPFSKPPIRPEFFLRNLRHPSGGISGTCEIHRLQQIMPPRRRSPALRY